MQYKIKTRCAGFQQEATFDDSTPLQRIFPCETCQRSGTCGLFSVNGIDYGEHYFSRTLKDLLKNGEPFDIYYLARFEKQCGNATITQDSEGVYHLIFSRGKDFTLAQSEVISLRDAINHALEATPDA